jgi:hypothetical protein
MYQKFSFSLIIISSIILLSCGKAAEDKATMLSNAKRIQDSLTTAIKNAIAEADMPSNMVMPAAVPATADTTKKK